MKELIPLFSFSFMLGYFFFFLLRDDLYPPLSENFFLTGIMGLALHYAAGDPPSKLILVFLCFGPVLALGYLLNHRNQKAKVEARLRVILRPVPDGLERDSLIEIAKVIVEPDFIPNSWINKLTGQKRTKMRESMAAYVREAYPAMATLTEKDFLPDKYQEDSSRKATGWLFAASVIYLLLGSIWMVFA